MMGKVVLDNRFWLMFLAPVVAGFFSIDTNMGGVFYNTGYLPKMAFYGFVLFYLFYGCLRLLKAPTLVHVLKNTMLCLSLLCAFVHFFVGHYFNLPFNQTLIDTLLATNLQESLAFVKGVIKPHIGLILGLLVFCGVFLALPLNVTLNSRQYKICLSLCALVFTVHSIRALYLYPKDLFISSRLALTPILREAQTLVASLREHRHIQALIQGFNKPLAKDYLSVDKDSVPNVVLVVGESASRNFMGVYGYSVPNTPFLSGLLREREREKAISLAPQRSLTQPNLFVFDDVISPFSGTMPVFQVLLNYSDRENAKTPWYKQKNIGDIFKVAGYVTFWLDNQEKPNQSNVYSLMSRHFSQHYYTDSPYKTDDSNLLPLFDRYIKPNLGAKNLILFHLIGSHVIYKDRSPKSYATFTPKDINYQGLHAHNDQDKQIVADYVNSLYYTDHVLSEIFKLFQGKDAIIFYLSDHAQDIFQSASTYGHKCSSYGVEIPFMVYVTSTFKQKHPEKVKLIEQAVHKPFMSDDLIHTLLPIVGIHTKDNLESKDLFSPKFDTKRKRVFCGDKPYSKP
ncbi:phosphoethanolamine transferase [Helicobacter heilmannii]|nr:phosphoethanolamine transferase [Helicobacter heilmannii]